MCACVLFERKCECPPATHAAKHLSYLVCHSRSCEALASAQSIFTHNFRASNRAGELTFVGGRENTRTNKPTAGGWRHLRGTSAVTVLPRDDSSLARRSAAVRAPLKQNNKKTSPQNGQAINLWTIYTHICTQAHTNKLCARNEKKSCTYTPKSSGSKLEVRCDARG